MTEEKTIERRWSLWEGRDGKAWVAGVDGQLPAAHQPVDVMPVEDYLAALGEATKEREDELCRCIECGHLQAEPNWCHRCGHRTSQPPWAKRLLAELEAAKGEQEAEKELAGLREGLERESEVLRERAKFAEERWADESRRAEVRCSARGEQLTATETADRLRQLLDPSEDTDRG